jgi:arsenate reductase (glutaredoxin)
MSDVTIWHNPRCTKSRQALALLQGEGVEPEVVRYLDAAPDRATLESVLAKLGLDDPRAMMRKGEARYRELGLAEASADELLDAMAANPILIERPIVIKGDRAVIGRPTEAVQTLL